MKIWNGLEAFPEGGKRVVATIGNFDGVHRGHREILGRVVDHARQVGLPSMLITFDPHPLSVIAPDRKPRLLQTRRQKLDALQETGIDEVLILTFNPALAELGGEEFFRDFVYPSVRFAAIHVGENFRFGQRRSGDLSLLRDIGDRMGFEVRVVEPVGISGGAVSSTAIRADVAAGEVERACERLGRPYEVTGKVVRGDGRGRTIDTPTANLEVENDLLPRVGVYVTETVALAARHESVTNIGVRPTVSDGNEVRLETHLIDFSSNLYGERIEVRFLARVRDEIKFASLTELADQIARDRAAAQAYFRGLPLRAG